MAYNSKHSGVAIDLGIDRANEAHPLVAEIAAARGQRTQLGSRLDTISNFASPNAGPNVVGRFMDQSFHAGSASTLSLAANRLDVSPFYTSQPLDVDQIGVNVTTAGAAGIVGRIGIWASDAAGGPAELVFGGTTELDLAVAGYRFHDQRFRFDSGRQYWIGIHPSGVATVAGIPTASLANLGLVSAVGVTAAAYASVLRNTPAYSVGLPATLVGATNTFINSVAASIRMRVAAPL